MIQFKSDSVRSSEQLFKLLNQIAEEKKSTMAQISLAWILNKHENAIPIPGSRKISRIEENFHAADIVLSREEMQKIDDLLKISDIPVFGKK